MIARAWDEASETVYRDVDFGQIYGRDLLLAVKPEGLGVRLDDLHDLPQVSHCSRGQIGCFWIKSNPKVRPPVPGHDEEIFDN